MIKFLMRKEFYETKDRKNWIFGRRKSPRENAYNFFSTLPNIRSLYIKMKGREWRFQNVVNEGRSYFLRRDIAYGSWGAILALFHEGGSTKSTKNKFFLIKSSKFHFKVLKNVFRTFLPEKIAILRKKIFWYLLKAENYR